MIKFIAPAFALLALAACSPNDRDDNGPVAGETPAAVMSATEASALMSESPSSVADISTMAGKWTGVEGTSLVIAPQGKDVSLVITDLDGPKSYTGTLVADGIAFVRDGQNLVIHKGSGADTGMKWLADKKDCLVVAANEGYCRD